MKSSDCMFFPVLGTLHSGVNEKSTVENQDELRLLVQCQMGQCESKIKIVGYMAVHLQVGMHPRAVKVSEGYTITPFKELLFTANSKDSIISN
jgi:hypothetical protein